MDLALLRTMCGIHAPSGDEGAMTRFVLDYVAKNQSTWKVQPQIFTGDEHRLQDCVVLVFGEPRTAIFAHMDSIGFTVKYGAEVVKIGGPVTESGFKLVGKDKQGDMECELNIDEEKNLAYICDREIETGTSLTFKPDWREDDDFVQCCYMDNRLGVWNALQVAKDLENGILVFSCWEEHGGGSAAYLGKFIAEKFNVHQALISDITWVTNGVHHGNGVAISMRDSGIPRQSFIRKIRAIAEEHSILHQIEVESAGGSDGNVLQRSPYPFDWCFIGAPEDHVHSPDEKVHKADIKAMVDLYKVLMKEL